MANSKLIAITNIVLWTLLIVHLIIFEILRIDSIVFVITGCVVLLGIVLRNGLFLYGYFKSHKKVLELQDEYIETLKPEKPLRFCPSDEELIRLHFEQNNTLSLNQQSKEDLQTTNEECEELEIE